MKRITFFPIEVRSEVDGERKRAHLCTCECASEEFIVFRIEGHGHLHLQCAECQESYCPRGECEAARATSGGVTT